MKARVFVTLKNGVLDPQGKAIGHALNGLGFGQVGDVRQGKVIDIDLSETDAAARESLKDMCEKLLANTVIEKYEIELAMIRGRLGASIGCVLSGHRRLAGSPPARKLAPQPVSKRPAPADPHIAAAMDSSAATARSWRTNGTWSATPMLSNIIRPSGAANEDRTLFTATLSDVAGKSPDETR